MAIADNIKIVLSKSSLIRQMFEKGAELKKIHGSENVFDLSLGNPTLAPPEQFTQELEKAAGATDLGIHGYMPNAGYLFTRQAVADFVSDQQQADVSSDDITMTCGAAGGLNVIFKSLLNPGDQVIVPSPYFVEYGFYVANSQGVMVTVETHGDFSLSIAAVAAAITPLTKVVLINSPNNPTGQIYSKESLERLGRLLKAKSRELGHTIYLVSDEPYRRIVYNDVVVPGIFTSYSQSLVVTSFSKDLSIPGERIGYIAVNPEISDRQDLLGAIALTNRTLGFVNAPALMQRVIPKVLEASVNMDEYARKRKLLCEGLDAAGYHFIKPAGAFYLFPECPIEDDMAFIKALQKERIIAVPGRAFNCPGYFRIAFCVKDRTIVDAMPGFAAVMDRFR